MTNATTNLLPVSVTIIFLVAILYAFLLTNDLFKYIAKHYPKYYEIIGSPKQFMILTDPEKLARNRKAVFYVWKWALPGLSNDLPKDKIINKMVSNLRIILFGFLLPSWLAVFFLMEIQHRH